MNKAQKVKRFSQVTTGNKLRTLPGYLKIQDSFHCSLPSDSQTGQHFFTANSLPSPPLPRHGRGILPTRYRACLCLSSFATCELLGTGAVSYLSSYPRASV